MGKMAAPRAVNVLRSGGSVTGCFSLCNRIYLHRQLSNQHRRCFFFQGQRNTAYSIVCPAMVSPAHPVPKHIKKPDYVTTGIVPDWGDDIEIKNEDQIQGLRQACQLARHVLLLAGKGLKVGMTTEEIDSIVHHEIIRQNAYPSPLGYGGFPKSVCTSVNNVVCHGIPDSRPLQDGDIINIDVTVYYNGYHGDTSETFLVGNVDKSGQKLVEVARKCRDEAIAACRPGAPFSVIGNTISSVARRGGFQVCPSFIGHGIGSYFHGHPEVWHHGKRPPPAGPASPRHPLRRRPRKDSGGGRGKTSRASHTHARCWSRRVCPRGVGGLSAVATLSESRGGVFEDKSRV
uniref:Methionine aminopeptidase n=1 Tax=Calidris pygmaea TaxID=425635 RepID=A0A8C3KLB9_9CHAR